MLQRPRCVVGIRRLSGRVNSLNRKDVYVPCAAHGALLERAVCTGYNRDGALLHYRQHAHHRGPHPLRAPIWREADRVHGALRVHTVMDSGLHNNLKCKRVFSKSYL